jgi:hypothetical protein
MRDTNRDPQILRLPLPMSSGVHILPTTCVEITARPQCPFSPDRLVIKHATRWRVEDVRIAGRSLISDLPGAAFSPVSVTSPIRDAFASRSQGERRPPMLPGDDVRLRVVYIGPEETGEPFEAALFGTIAPPDSRGRSGGTAAHDEADGAAAVEVEEVEAVARSMIRILPNTSIRLGLTSEDFPAGKKPAFYPERISIEDATDWIVNDVLLGGRSLFTQSGDLPAELLSSRDVLQIGRLDRDDELALVMTYVGSDYDGAELVCRVRGTIKSREHLPPSTLLPMSSYVNIPLNTSAQIVSRARDLIPGGCGFQARHVVVRDPADWVINDVKIGRVSQFAQNGDVPGVAFSGGDPVAFDPIQVGVDVTMVVTYVGASASGAAFVCGLAGDVVDLGDRSGRDPTKN